MVNQVELEDGAEVRRTNLFRLFGRGEEYKFVSKVSLECDLKWLLDGYGLFREGMGTRFDSRIDKPPSLSERVGDGESGPYNARYHCADDLAVERQRQFSYASLVHDSSELLISLS